MYPCTYPNCACIQSDDCDQFDDNIAGVSDEDYVLNDQVLEEVEIDVVEMMLEHHLYDSLGG